MDKEGASGALVKTEGIQSSEGGTVLYFCCDDVAIESECAVAAEGRIQQHKMSLGQYRFIALIVDKGNMIGLYMPSKEMA